MASDTIVLKLRRATDSKLDCIVCRRTRVDAQIQYGTNGGSAAQGIHLRCIGRAQAPWSRRRAPVATSKTYEDGLRDAATVAQRIAWDCGITGIAMNRNPALEVHQAILAMPSAGPHKRVERDDNEGKGNG